jgi:hypothetical protein
MPATISARQWCWQHHFESQSRDANNRTPTISETPTQSLNKGYLQQQAHKDLRDFFPILEFLSDSDSPTHRLGDFSVTNLLADLASRGVVDSSTRRVGNSPTLRVGVSFSDYEYLREYEAEFGTARKVV